MQPQQIVQLLVNCATQEHIRIKMNKHCACRAHRANTRIKEEKTALAKTVQLILSVRTLGLTIALPVGKVKGRLKKAVHVVHRAASVNLAVALVDCVPSVQLGSTVRVT